LNIKIGSLRAPSIGHLISNTIRYFETDLDGLHIIVNNKKDFVNYAAYNLLKEKYKSKSVFFFDSFFIFFCYRIFLKLSKMKYFLFLNRYIVNIDFIHKDNGVNLKYGSIYEVSIDGLEGIDRFAVPNNFHNELEIWKNENAINGKFVCVFTRDDGYYGFSGENIRNSNFEELIPSIKHLISCGYWVVRIGRKHIDDNLSNTISSSMYIDYGNSDSVSDILDLMLIKECNLLITGSSGIACIQFLFGTKMLYHNAAPLGMWPQFNNCKYIMKKYTNNNKIIPFNQVPEKFWLEEDLGVIKENGYDVIDNTSIEILNAVKDELSNQVLPGVTPRFDFIVSRGNSKINKQWFDNNQKYFH